MALAYTPQDVDATVRTVIGESSPNPAEQQMVAAVIRNRAATSGASPSAVVSAPGQFEAWSRQGGHLSSIDPASPVYQRTLSNIAPVLRGDALGDVTADHFYAPTAQADLGRKPPAWDDGSGQQIGQSKFFTAGGNYGIGGAQGTIPRAPVPPSPADFSSRNGLNAVPPQAPSPQDFAKRNGISAQQLAQPPQAAPESASMQKARADAQAYQAKAAASEPGWVEPLVNSVMLGASPLVGGGANAARTGIQNALAGVGIGKPAGYSAGDAFVANRDAIQQGLNQYAQAHPVANAAANVAGFVGSAPGKIVGNLVTKGIETAAPRLATNVAGRIATRAGANAGVAAMAGANQGLSQGQSASSVLASAGESALFSVPFSLGGEGLNAVGSAFRNPAVRAVALPAAGAALGSAYGASPLGRGQVTENALAGAALGYGASRGMGSTEATPADRQSALDMIAREGSGPQRYEQAASALENAPSLYTTAEALPTGDKLAQQAHIGAKVGETPIENTIGQRSEPNAVLGRISQGVTDATGLAPEDQSTEVANRIQSERQALEQRSGAMTGQLSDALRDATGVDPATSQADIKTQVDAIKQGIAKPLWDAVDQTAPTYSDDLAELSKEPEVRSALDWARRKIGTSALIDNPNAALASDGRPVVSAADYRAWLQGGNPANTEALVNPSKQPQQVPTAETWIMAQRDLAGNVARDPITKQVLPDSVAQGNSKNLHWARQLNGAIMDAIPGLSEAKAASGDYLSAGEAYQNGRGLHSNGRNAETSGAFADRYANLSPGEQQATKSGYMAEVYRKLENGQLRPEQLQTDFHKSAQETMFGSEGRDAMQGALSKEAEVRDQAKNGGPLESAAGFGQRLFGGNKILGPADAANLRSQFEAMTPEQKEMAQRSYLAEWRVRLEKGSNGPEVMLNSPYHRAVQEMLFGPRSAGEIRAVLEKEAALAKSGTSIVRAAKPTHALEPSHGSIATGAAIGAAEGGVHGAIRGATAAAFGKGVSGALETIKAGRASPAVRSALADLLAQDPKLTAAELRARAMQRQSVPLNKSTLASALTRGAAVAGGTGVANAFSGIGP